MESPGQKSDREEAEETADPSEAKLKRLASGSLRVSIGIAESFRVVVVKEEERLTFSTLSSTWCAGEMGYKEFDLHVLETRLGGGATGGSSHDRD